MSKPAKKKAFQATVYNTKLATWFERDRSMVALVRTSDEEHILTIWDELVSELVEDGLLNPRDYHASLIKLYGEGWRGDQHTATTDEEESED